MYRIFFCYLSTATIFLSTFTISTELFDQLSTHRASWIPLILEKLPSGQAQHIVYIDPQQGVSGLPVKETLFYPEGTLRFERDVAINSEGRLILEGVQVEYHPSGSLKNIALFHNNFIEGTALSYHSNGNQAQQMTYEKGVPEGLSYMWDEKGHLLYETHYFRGLLHNDNKTPAFQKFNTDHLCIEAQHYFYGQPHGLHTRYSDDGVAVYTVNYLKGKKA